MDVLEMVSSGSPIGAYTLGDVHGRGRQTEDGPPRRCQEPGCGTFLRSSNPGRFCALHSRPVRRGAHFVATERRRRMHVVR